MFQKVKNHLPLNVKITLISFLSIIIVFNFWRLIFLYSYIEYFNESNLLYIKSFLIGLKSDAVISAQISMLVFIISFFPKIKFKKHVKFIYYFSMFLLFIIIGFLSAIDLEFFKEMGAHLNIQAQMYGFESGSEPWIQAWVAYPIFSYLFIIFFISYLAYKISKKWISNSKKSHHSKKPYKELVYIIFFTTLLSLGTNGFERNPFNPKKSFFSKSVMANQLAINNIQYYIYSIIKQPDLNFYNTKKADKILHDLLNENRSRNQIVIPEINIKKDSLNIALIILESHTGIHCNYLNPELEEKISPFLDSLSRKSINFKNCYSNGTRTAYGLSSILCSWPVIPGYPLNRYKEYQDKESTNPTFSSLMKDINNNYKNTFIYGGNSEFDQMKPFVKANQFDKVIDRLEDSDLKKLKLDNKNQGVNPWGIFDEHLFKKYIELMDNTHTPTFTTILTTTNHVPWIIPDSLKSKILNYTSKNKNFEDSKKTMIYVDMVLEKFFNEIEDKDWFENTIFIITADHGLNIYKNHINDSRNGIVPFLIYNKNLSVYPKDVLEITKTVSHLDILPTFLDLIGSLDIFPDSKLFGCSGFKGTNGFAFRNNDNNIQWIKDGLVYSENVGFNFEESYPEKNNIMISTKSKIQNLKKQCRAYSQNAFSITK